MAEKTTRKPHTEHGELSTKEHKEPPDSVLDFPKQRKEPLTDASHVKNAFARFDQVEDVSDGTAIWLSPISKRRRSITGSPGRSKAGATRVSGRTPKSRLTPDSSIKPT